jgi:hypothetical protein
MQIQTPWRDPLIQCARELEEVLLSWSSAILSKGKKIIMEVSGPAES